MGLGCLGMCDIDETLAASVWCDWFSAQKDQGRSNIAQELGTVPLFYWQYAEPGKVTYKISKISLAQYVSDQDVISENLEACCAHLE